MNNDLKKMFERDPCDIASTVDLDEQIAKFRKERELAQSFECPLGMVGDRLREILAPATSLEEASEILKRLHIDELVDPANIEFGKLTQEIAAKLAKAEERAAKAIAKLAERDRKAAARAEKARAKAEAEAARAAAREVKRQAKRPNQLDLEVAIAAIKADPRPIDLEDQIDTIDKNSA